MSMTPTERATIERELSARAAYIDAVRVHGPQRFVVPQRPGFGVKRWDGTFAAAVFATRRLAAAMVRELADGCAARAGELRAQLVAADMDRDRADVSEADRLAGAKAYAEARGPRGFSQIRRSA